MLGLISDKLLNKYLISVFFKIKFFEFISRRNNQQFESFNAKCIFL